MDIEALSIEAVKLVRPFRHGDARGYVAETWNREAFAAAGIAADFVQDIISFSVRAGTIRGLHYQRLPRAQAKLVRVVRGAIYDVALDLRRASSTFGQHVAVRLTADDGGQLFVPLGFAHGFCTLEPGTEVAYKVSDFYAREHDTGVSWNDPALGIEWPLGGRIPILSERDRELPRLADVEPEF